jgi:hypothetical protein
MDYTWAVGIEPNARVSLKETGNGEFIVERAFAVG